MIRGYENIDDAYKLTRSIIGQAAAECDLFDGHVNRLEKHLGFCFLKPKDDGELKVATYRMKTIDTNIKGVVDESWSMPTELLKPFYDKARHGEPLT